MDKLKIVLNTMTKLQKRRYLYYLKGWSLTRIAKKEGVSVKSIHISLKSAKKRAKKRLNTVKTR